MKPFLCVCGNRVFFENVRCLKCQRELGFVPEHGTMASLEPADDGTYRAHVDPETPRRKCQNYQTEGVCNWLCEPLDENPLCRACQLNRIVPDLSIPENRVKWARIETAKRRLLFTLAELGLPVKPKRLDPERGLAFDFKADTQDSVVLTGHDDSKFGLAPADADLHLQLGHLFKIAGCLSQAAAYYEAAVSLGHTNPEEALRHAEWARQRLRTSVAA